MVISFQNGGRLLDIGCGDGRFLREKATPDWEVYGVETAKISLNLWLRINGITCYHQELTRLNLPSQYFNVITLWHVLDHIRDPRRELKEIARILEEEGIIKGVKRFAYLTKFKRVSTQIKAGEYPFSTQALPLEVLEKLVKGEYISKITIPEGYNIFQIAQLLKMQGFVNRKRFLKLALDPSFVSLLGIEGKSLEGSLFPDTYNLIKGMGEEPILKKMVSRFKEVYRSYEDLAKKKGLFQKEVVIIASLIEKETPTPSERPIISAVFQNRLKRGMRLQSDPTAIYRIQGFKGRITKEDLQRKTPYNTYRFEGLPPEPISNPSEASIRAVLYPARVDYLYFVSKNDGTHHFSKTLAEHNSAVEKYQKGKE